MRFPTYFKRRKGGSGDVPLLGSDSVPSGQAKANTDNCLMSKFSNISGWPVHRIAVVYKYTGVGPAPDLPGQMYFYEERTQGWFKIGAVVTLKNGETAFFDVVSIADPPNVVKELDSGGAGSLQQLLIVSDNAGADGTYEFAVGPDLTTFP